MMAPLAVAQLPCWHDIWASVRSLGFLMGVACSFVVLLICWLIEFSRRMRRKNKVLRVEQADGGELVLTYKAIRTHVRLLLEREFAALSLKGIEINGGAEKSMRLHVIAAEGAKLSEIRGQVCNRLSRSFKEDLGLADAIKGISVDVEEFRKAEGVSAAPVKEAPQEAVTLQDDAVPLEKDVQQEAAPQEDLVVPELPSDVTPLASAPQKQDDDNDNDDNNDKKDS
jgi:hypothetical protein